jgi:putative endonuclease
LDDLRMSYYVYMLASQPQGTLYVGVTNDRLRRVSEHRDGVIPGFTRKYGVKRLVYWEQYGDIREAIAREKTLKRWRRDRKRALIEEKNPNWTDLFPDFVRAEGYAAPPPLPPYRPKKTRK